MRILKNFKTGLAGIALAASMGATQAYSDIVTYTPNINDLWDLDHNTALTWGVTDNWLRGQVVLSATLTIENIRDWQIESDDMLYLRLLGSAQDGVRYWADMEAPGDYFAGQGTGLTVFSDLLPYTIDELLNQTTTDLTYTFNGEQIAALNLYAADGNFGLSFDPDCHYYNDGVSLVLTTRPVPEPGSMALMGLGLLGLGAFLRRKKS